MLTVALAFNPTTVPDKDILQSASRECLLRLLWWCLVVAPAIFLMIGSPRLIRKQYPVNRWLLLPCFALAMTRYRHFVALKQVEVVYFSSVKCIGIVFAISYRVLLFHEGRPGHALLTGPWQRRA